MSLNNPGFVRRLPEVLAGNWRWLLILVVYIAFVSKAAYNVFLLAMFFTGLYHYFRNPDSFTHWNQRRLYLLIVALSLVPALVSLVDAVNMKQSMRSVSVKVPLLFVGFYLFWALSSIETARKLTIAVAALVAFWCVDAVIQYLAGYNLFGQAHLKGSNRVSGMFTPRQVLGFVVGTLSPLVFELVRLYWRRYRWMLLLPVIVVIAVIMGGVRSGWISLLTAMFLYAIYLGMILGARQTFKLLAVGLGVLIMAGLLAYQTAPVKNYVQRTAGLFSMNYDKINAATSYRLPLWATAYRTGRENWFNGVGYRGFRHVYPQYAPKGDMWVQKTIKDKNRSYAQMHPHQALLEIWAESGIVGVVCYIITLVLLISLALKAVRQHRLLAVPWFLSAIVAISPVNAHVAYFGSFWFSLLWVTFLTGLAIYNLPADTEESGFRNSARSN